MSIMSDITVYAGSVEDDAALAAVLADPAVVAELDTADVFEFPAVVWTHWKGASAPAHRRNVRVDGDSVLEFRGAGEQPARRSRDKYERDLLVKTFEAIDAAPHPGLAGAQARMRSTVFRAEG